MAASSSIHTSILRGAKTNCPKRMMAVSDKSHRSRPNNIRAGQPNGQVRRQVSTPVIDLDDDPVEFFTCNDNLELCAEVVIDDLPRNPLTFLPVGAPGYYERLAESNKMKAEKQAQWEEEYRLGLEKALRDAEKAHAERVKEEEDNVEDQPCEIIQAVDTDCVEDTQEEVSNSAQIDVVEEKECVQPKQVPVMKTPAPRHSRKRRVRQKREVKKEEQSTDDNNTPIHTGEEGTFGRYGRWEGIVAPHFSIFDESPVSEKRIRKQVHRF